MTRGTLVQIAHFQFAMDLTHLTFQYVTGMVLVLQQIHVLVPQTTMDRTAVTMAVTELFSIMLQFVQEMDNVYHLIHAHALLVTLVRTARSQFAMD